MAGEPSSPAFNRGLFCLISTSIACTGALFGLRSVVPNEILSCGARSGIGGHGVANGATPGPMLFYPAMKRARSIVRLLHFSEPAIGSDVE